ncbi:hypothetical protein FLK61_24705 [Paenalkalicoccus suaedae]|uniref:Uncharacterized protein n=1 Tax=Paenalkalicoccus suaedae TaxID=2592382 RepID=A0A859F9Z4_9BACI|nr:hypothetical protein [Paenalkalicoccus suaedae]QKS69979.1 hypothetical protein FLK61_24705 [Paenalkalicoccus suaedae]
MQETGKKLHAVIRGWKQEGRTPEQILRAADILKEKSQRAIDGLGNKR